LALDDDDDDDARFWTCGGKNRQKVPPNVPNRPTFGRLAKSIDELRRMSPSSKVASSFLIDE